MAPVGLLGVLMMTMRVVGPMARSIASRSSWKVRGSVGTSTQRQFQAWMYMRYSAKYGTGTITSSPAEVTAAIVAVIAPAQPPVMAISLARARAPKRRLRFAATACRVVSQPLLGG